MAKRGTYEKGARRREEILDSAMAVIGERGFHATTLRAVGRELGIEPAHVLYYFGSREGLLRAVLERWDADNDPTVTGEDLLEGFTHAIAKNQQIRGVIHLYLAFAVEAVEERHSAHEFYRRRFASAIGGLATAISHGQERGAIDQALHPERAARRLVALADGLQLQWMYDDTLDVTGELRAAIEELAVPSPRPLAP